VTGHGHSVNGRPSAHVLPAKVLVVGAGDHMIELGAISLTVKVGEFITKGRPRSFAVYNQSDKTAYFSICYVEQDLSIGWAKVPPGSHLAWEHMVPLVGYWFRVHARTAGGKKVWHNDDNSFFVGMPSAKLTGREFFRMRRCFDAKPHVIDRQGISRYVAVPSRQFYLTGDYTYTLR
jgi:hypothetical protein